MACTLVSAQLVKKDVFIDGIGSPLPDRLYQSAIFAYRMVRPEVHITYDPIGSTAANAAIVDNSVHFIGTDKLFTEEEYNLQEDLQLFPACGTGVVPVYNLEKPKVQAGQVEVDYTFTLTRELMVKIWLREVTKWNNTEIVALNSEMDDDEMLTGAEIELVVRSDNTKINEMLYESLHRFYNSGEVNKWETRWKATYGDDVPYSTESRWPKMDPLDTYVPTAINGNEALANYLAVTYNTFSYALLSDAVEFGMNMGTLKNKQDVSVRANHLTLGNAVADLGSKFDDVEGEGENKRIRQFTAVLYDSGGTTAWPIVAYSYLGVRMDPNKWLSQNFNINHDCDHRKGIASFWKWYFNSGLIRSMCPWLGYASLPDAVIKIIIVRFVQELFCNKQGTLADNRDDEIRVIGYGLPQFADVFKIFQYAYAGSSQTQMIIEFNLEDDPEYRPLDTEASYMITTFQDQSQNKYAQFPIAFYSIIPIYNLWNLTSGEPVEIIIDLEVLTNIFRGDVTHWTDPALLVQNPHLEDWDSLGLPHDDLITLMIRGDSCDSNDLFTRGLPNYPRSTLIETKPLVLNNYVKWYTDMQIEAAVQLNSGSFGYKISVGGTQNQIPLIKQESIFYDEPGADVEADDYEKLEQEVVVDPTNVTYLQACRDASSLNTFSGELLISIEPIRSQNGNCYVWTSVLYLRLKANYLSGGTGKGCKPDSGALGNLAKWYLSGTQETTVLLYEAGFTYFHDTLYSEYLLRGVDSLTCDQTVSLLWDPSDICSINDWDYGATECVGSKRLLVHSWKLPRTCRKGYPLPAELVIPCQNISNSGVSALTFVGWTFVFIIGFIIYDNRTHMVIKRCVTIQQSVLLGGCFLLYSLPFLEKSIDDLVCFLSPVINIVGGGLVLGSLAYQTHAAKKPLVFVSLIKYLIYHGILMGVYVIIILFWMSVDAPEKIIVTKDYGLESTVDYDACNLSNMFMLVMYLSQLPIILICTWIAWGARMSPGQFNIAQHNFWACCFFLIRVIVRCYFDRVTYFDQFDPDGKYGSFVFTDVLAVTAVLVAFWVPRISILYFGENQDDLPSSFEIMLEDAVTRHFIEKLAAKQVMAENVKFYTAVKHFKSFCDDRNPDDPEVHAYAKRVYNTYIKENGAQQVNIADSLLNQCNKALKFQADKSTMFDGPLREIKKVCEQNVSKPFMASKEVDKANSVNKWCENFNQFEYELQQRVMESLKSHVTSKEENELTVEDTTSIEIKKVVEEKIEELHELLTMNILLLGCGESGKSTFARSLKYRERGDVDQSDVDMVKAALRDNALTSILGLYDAAVSSHCAERMTEESRSLMKTVINCRDEQGEFDKSVAKAVLKLWQDPVIQDMSMAKHEHWNLEMGHYYTKNARRFANPNFIPTKEDMCYARVHDSLSITDITIVEDELTEEFTYRLMDFAGHRHFRHKWRTSIGHPSSRMVVYTINLAGIFSVTMEDNNVFRITESLRVLEHLMSLPWFKSIPLFVVYTKKDLFQELVQDCDFGTLLQVFPSFAGSDDAASILNYLYSKVIDICKPNRGTTFVTFNCFDKKEHMKLFKQLRRTCLSKNKAKLKPLIRRIRMVIEAASGDNDEAENPLAGASSDSRAMLGLNF